MKKEILDEYSMRQTSIYELRNLARGVGVKSPTTLKKEELIAKVLKILSGEEKPEMPKSKQGRPPKYNKLQIENDYNDSQYNNIFGDSSIKDFNTKEIGILSSKKNFDDEVDYDAYKFSIEEKTGYYYVMEDGYSFIFECGRVCNVDSAILVSKNITEKYNLNRGDLVKCICKNIAINNTRFIMEVLEINGKGVSQTNLNIADFSNIICSKEETLYRDANNKILYGSRNVVLGQNKQVIINFIDNVKSFNKDSKIKFLRLRLEVLPEELTKYTNRVDEEVFYTEINDSVKQNIFTIELFLQRIKRLAELGNNVVVLVEDISKTIKFKNFLEGYSIKDIKGKSLDLCNKILVSSRCIEKGSVTVLAGLKNSIKDDFYNILLEQLEEINCLLVEV